MLHSILFICCGACAGSVLRWALSQLLNPVLPEIPLGTLFVNLAGSFVMGFLSAFFLQFPNQSGPWKLALITGFCGSFTTFSTFSGEVGNMILAQRLFLATLTIGLHVFGSIAMFLLGLLAFGLIRKCLLV